METTFLNDRARICKAHEALDHFASRHGLPDRLAADLHVAIEEHLTNVICYGYPKGQKGEISVRLEPGSDEVRIEIEDDGIPFNPMEAPEVDTSIPLDKRPIGGLGIHMMRKLTDRLEYERKDNRNRLVMLKRWKSSSS